MSDQNTEHQDQTEAEVAEAEVTEQDTQPETGDQDEAAHDDQQDGDQDDDGGKVRKVRKEAANYRQRARDAEAERDTLKERVEALEWREVQRHIPTGAPKLEALQKLGLELDEVRDDTGDIDPVKVNTVVEAAAEMVGVSLNAAPRMPLEGKAPASQAIPADVASSLQKALTGK